MGAEAEIGCPRWRRVMRAERASRVDEATRVVFVVVVGQSRSDWDEEDGRKRRQRKKKWGTQKQ